LTKISEYLKNIRKKISRKSFFEYNQKMDQDFVFDVVAENDFPSLKQLKYIGKFYNRTETIITKTAIVAATISATILCVSLYKNHIKIQPANGGEYAEAVIGAPTYINPLFSETNDVDQDLTRLLFSSLMKTNEQGHLVGDLVKNYSISEDQKTYTFTLKKDIKWHDGEDLDADDIMFTFQSIQNKNFKSTLYQTFKSVTVQKIDEGTFSITLSEPFAPFLTVLTFGILPQHLWSNINPDYALLAELNLKPIGSGPYKFSSFSKDKSGNIKQYSIERFKDYYEDGPYIKKITFKFFQNFEEASSALSSGNADGFGFLPQSINTYYEKEKNENLTQYKFSLPQYTALFFNQKSNSALSDLKVRQALALAISKYDIIEAAFSGFAEPINAPILEGMTGYSEDLPVILNDTAKAEKMLDDLGWKRIIPEKQNQEQSKENETNQEISEEQVAQPETIEENQDNSVERASFLSYTREKNNQTLELSLIASQNEKNIIVAEKIREQWEKIGVKVNLQIIDPVKLQKETIQTRAYEVLLFGQILGTDPDPYSFWHSSQANHPGLNLAMYANRDIDKLLEEARKTSSKEEREQKYFQFQKKILEETAAIFLYSIQYTYSIPKEIKGVETTRINHTSDRFSNIENWYIKTKRRIQF